MKQEILTTNVSEDFKEGIKAGKQMEQKRILEIIEDMNILRVDELDELRQKIEDKK